MYNHWYGKNEYVFPRFGHLNDDRTRRNLLRNIFYGGAVAAIVSFVYKSPPSRILKSTAVFGMLNAMYSTRGLYCSRKWLTDEKMGNDREIIDYLLEEAKHSKSPIIDKKRVWFKRIMDNDRKSPVEIRKEKSSK
ncbi:hypothetical protein MHBO_003299 [Bonamia ostreae]|uniref:Uncharacterized protein n=1 Tax=Bonamia ostreae TaxID=126728 RepID=A0ABV2AQ25_9EUKA